MHILILYSSRDGQTRKISRFIASALTDTATCDVVDLSQADDCPLQNYDGIIIGAAIRYGHYSADLHNFIRRHLDRLNTLPSAFFSVNLTARKPDKRTPETNVYTRKFLAATPWRPDGCAVFAGALRYPQYRWLDRVMIQLIMRMTGGETDSSKEVEYTDWEQVTAFARDFAVLTDKASRQEGEAKGFGEK
ncbi:menaquinone-dependent protoporphyrinogen IX dehydrogenase [Sodalis ligni]|jgi:menaquinone-dependent protoporphyrinogen oxidase|uniref:Protoporphyrinogen IX dehydrogenase [quinone] n=1 Tax=Sodalis ligni TaxID=2697027 RepID=A0A4R1NH36_9GAMM|nr:menaquinone-dependent protoporphyrinogen IX dehydrogenase [Sodalis ligni]TCL05121.1 menaquinone-dependent protoporphyrinogen oxidase [Sodalis ligni]